VGTALGLLLLPIGVAHLAQNSVDTSYVGEAEAQVSIAVTLAVDARDAHVNLAQDQGKDYYHFTNLKATLTDAGGAVNGEPIVFTADGVILCSAPSDKNATTQGQGLATCNAKVAVADFAGVPTTYTATFAGDGALQPSQAVGALTATGDGNGHKQDVNGPEGQD
jgi:hypothetical protein